jgi:YfiH family protein
MPPRHRAGAADHLWWRRTWPMADGGCVRAGLTGRSWPGNLSLDVGDDAAAVNRRRHQLSELTGGMLLMPTQVHGSEVAVVEEPWGRPPSADAVVTGLTGVTIAVGVADCVPVMLVDPGARLIGVAHAGRRGMQLGVAAAAAQAMRDLGATAIDAVLGPSICARCYEVPHELRDTVAGARPITASVTRTGTASLDVAAGVIEQLAGLTASIDVVPGCTVESDDLFSYRREAQTGRFVALVWIDPTDPSRR